MTRINSLRHEFVEFIPDAVDEGVLYVSITFCTVIHRCGCGCGSEVVTPLDPSDWKMTFDGKTVSLYPSIGNWSLACQSHYWIHENRVRWARPMSAALRGARGAKRWTRWIKSVLTRTSQEECLSDTSPISGAGCIPSR